MSIYECSITNPKKQLEFYKDLSEQLQVENQALKEQVDYLRRSIERKEETIIDLEHERVPYTNEYVEELKKQLEEINYTCVPNSDIKNVIDKYKNQQKEFIDWLEENYKNTQDIWYIKILNKYKEIIGDNNE